MHHPRLLLITSSNFNNLSGGGITFTNLFHGWPKDKIACAHSDRITPTTDVCDRYYFLGNKEFSWGFPFSLAKYFGLEERVENILRQTKGSPTTPTKGVQVKKNFLSRAVKILQPIARLFFGDELPTKARVTHELRQWICEFRPEVIYTILGNRPYMALVREIAREFKLPVVIHMMDDWPEMMYRRGIFGLWRRGRMKKELQQIMNKAAACLAICPSMAKAYEKRYGRKFSSFHNAVDADAWLKKARKDWKRKSPFVMVYAGALMANSQAKSVRDACDSVEQLYKDGLDIEFHIYAPWYAANRYRSELERPKCVKVFDAPDTMDIESLFAKADLLLLPVNFDKESVRYIRYSMPTKVPAYMFSGTPTLAYGPSGVASIQYAEDFAHCVTRQNPKELKNAIQTLASDEDLRKHFALKAQKLASERHDREKVSRAFQKILIDTSI
ncbi:hypothetical protein HYW83_00150 [Candidatus Peregrinibacteria bacterium]|nr:hypothetical protein [Candidatus Peregrinibacteria bacterium]